MDTLGEIIVRCQSCGQESIVTLVRLDEKRYARCRNCKAFLFEYRGVRGYIYILSNPKMPGLFKIGLSTRPLQERIDELSSATGVPAPFQLEAAFVTADPQLHESQIHAELSEWRVQGKEFFSMHISKAIAVAEAVCTKPPFYLNPNNKHFQKLLLSDTGKYSATPEEWH